VIESPRAARPAAARSDEDAQIFDEDDVDLTETQEFDKALAEGSEALPAGEPSRAKLLLEKALRHKPRNQRARNLLGLTLFKLGELEKAESLYRGLIEDHPADPTLRVNLGLVFLKAGASSDAVRCFETTLDLQPDHLKAQNYLGLSLAQKGDHAKARDWFLKCGNGPMAERMEAALLAAPLREVAEGASEQLSQGGQPFQSALGAQEAPPAQVPAQAQPVLETAAPAQETAASAQQPAAMQAQEPAAAPEGAAPVGTAPPAQTAEEVKTGAIATPPQGSQWVAKSPGAEDGEIKSTWPLARINVNRGNSQPVLAVPDRHVLADAHAAHALAQDDGDAKHRDTDPQLRPVPPPAEESQAVADAAAAHAAVHTESPAEAAAEPPTEKTPLMGVPAAVRGLGAAGLTVYTGSRRMSVPAGEGSFLTGPNEAVIQVNGELLTRLDGLVASWGTATLKPELKRFRGKATDKPFGEGARRMLRAQGQGRYVVARENRCFTALELGDEPAYFREEILFAFEESLVFENGRVPSKVGTDLHLVHLRGRGKLLLVTTASPRSVDVARGEPLRIPMDQLVGWHGPLIQPRLVPIVEEAPELGVALELSGEGRALVDAPEGR
jgi:Flp pilus assembly protein TadD/uncharacterized protein (AIM24 family)